MPSFPIECYSVEDAIDQLKLRKTPYWSLWSGTTLKCVYNENDDMEASELLLTEQLDGFKAINYNGILVVRVYDNGKKVNSKSGYTGSFNIQLNEPGQFVGQANGHQQGPSPNVFVLPNKQQPSPPPDALTAVLLQIAEQNKMILDRLTAQDDEEEEEEEEEEDEELILERKVQMISGVVERFTPALNVLLDRIFPVKNSSQNNDYIPQNIGDMGNNTTPVTPENANQRMHTAIQQLEQKIGPIKLVEALEALAAKGELQLKGMISMLG